MFRAFVLCVFLVFTICEVRSEKSQPIFVKVASSVVKRAIDSAHDDLLAAHKELEENYHSLVADGKKQIEAEVDHAANRLKRSSFDEGCVKQGLLQLQNLKSVGSDNFFTCANLTTAAKDVAGLAWSITDFVSESLKRMDDVFNGMIGCSTNWWNVVKLVQCWFGYISTAISDIISFPGLIRDLVTKMQTYTIDIKNNIQYCMNHQKSEIALLSNQVIKQAHLCSGN